LHQDVLQLSVTEDQTATDSNTISSQCSKSKIDITIMINKMYQQQQAHCFLQKYTRI
jgi:hypothetical protein